MMLLSRILLSLSLSSALVVVAAIPPPPEVHIPAASTVAQDPVFQKLFSPAKSEGAFQSSLVNVADFKVEIHINGVGKNLIADLVTRKVALDGRGNEPAADGIRASVSIVEDLGGLVMHENPPFEYLQLNQQVIEERASTTVQAEIYRESRLLGNIRDDRMACLRELYSRFYRGWIVRVQLGDWREDYYFFYPRNSNQLLALAAIKIRPVPNGHEAMAFLNRIQPLYGFRSEGTLANGFNEGASRGSIWFQSVSDSDWSRSAAPDPKGIKKLWITPSWSAYVTGLFDLARTKWLDQKRQALGLPTNQDVIETMLTDLKAQIERSGELGAAMGPSISCPTLLRPRIGPAWRNWTLYSSRPPSGRRRPGRRLRQRWRRPNDRRRNQRQGRNSRPSPRRSKSRMRTPSNERERISANGTEPETTSRSWWSMRTRSRRHLGSRICGSDTSSVRAS